jgi:hypothetical protein
MIKLAQLAPKVLIKEAEEKELPEEFKCFERGFEFLKQRIAELNKKALKYKVPPLEIVIVKEEMVKVIHPDIKKMQMSQPIIMPLDKGLLADPNTWVLAKQYTLSLKGEPPHVDGYEFIARLEHTPEGNFIYTSPHSSVPNLPAEFKTVNQHCDVCHTNRDRNDTFVIKMEKDDPERFPDKKAGDMIVVGRNCLARFLPGISVSGLIAYTNMIEATQFDVKEAQDMDSYEPGMGGGGGKYYEPAESLLFWIAATYMHTGRYMSKSQANKNAEAGMGGPMVEATISRALSEMRPNLMGLKGQDPKKAYPIYFKVKDDDAFRQKVEELCKEFQAWFPTKDWEKLAQEKPDKADFIHNMALVGKQDYLKSQYFGFYSALFQFFLRDKKADADKAEAQKQAATLPPSPVQFNDPTIVGKRLRDVAKEGEIKRLLASGMDEKAIKKAVKGHEWGWEVTVKRLTEYEKTQTFGYGDSGIGYRILFADAFGNDFMWFASSTLGMQENGKYLIDGTVTGFEEANKYHPNKPQVRINRVKVIKDLQHPDAPMPPVVAME